MRRLWVALVLGAGVLLPGCGEEDGPLAPPEPFPTAGIPPGYSLQWGTSGEGEGEFYQPGDIDVAPDGSVLVIDHQNHRIQKFTADGQFLTQWGQGPPTGNIFSRLLSGVAVGWGKVYVSDFGRALWVLDEAGNPIGFWDYYALYGGLAVNSSGNVYVSGYKIISRFPILMVDGPAVWALTRDGREFGRYDLNTFSISPGPLGTLYGVRVYYENSYPFSTVVHFTAGGRVLSEWRRPAESAIFDNITADAQGLVYVVSRPYQGVLQFDRAGRLLARWQDTGGDKARFSWATSVALSPGNALYVSDFFNDRVVKFVWPLPGP